MKVPQAVEIVGKTVHGRVARYCLQRSESHIHIREYTVYSDAQIQGIEQFSEKMANGPLHVGFWVSFDISATQKLIKKIGEAEHLSDAKRADLAVAARQRLHHGFRENSWLLLTKGTDYELIPKAAAPVRVVRTFSDLSTLRGTELKADAAEWPN